MQKKIGLFFGSFNPIHIGHLALANYFLSFNNLNEVWLMVSPQNPFKTKSSLLPFRKRFNLVHLALNDHPKIKVSDFEAKLPVPSYTSITLAKLKEKYPDFEFSIIMGEDNLEGLHKWKNVDYILDNFNILVYPRSQNSTNILNDKLKSVKNIQMSNAPIIEISSSFIRESIKQKKDLTFFLPTNVYEYITSMNYYQNT